MTLLDSLRLAVYAQELAVCDMPISADIAINVHAHQSANPIVTFKVDVYEDSCHFLFSTVVKSSLELDTEDAGREPLIMAYLRKVLRCDDNAGVDVERFNDVKTI